jgi:hypothetical protein
MENTEPWRFSPKLSATLYASEMAVKWSLQLQGLFQTRKARGDERESLPVGQSIALGSEQATGETIRLAVRDKTPHSYHNSSPTHVAGSQYYRRKYGTLLAVEITR